jgi:hypothetical protein
MATALDIIKRALRIAKVIEAAETPEAEDSQDALTTLNAVLAEMYEAQIGLPDYSLASLTTELASDAADREAIAYQLAYRLVGEYGTQMAPTDMEIVAATMSRMRLRYFQPGRVDAALPSTRDGYDIDNG